MGVVLRAPAGAEPRYDAPFLIVDRHLAVQAVSRHAEVMLSVDEPAGIGIPLEELLIFDNGHCDNRDVAHLVELAIGGAEPSNRLELRSRQPEDPPLRPGYRLRAPTGRSARPDPARGACDGGTQRTAGHQREVSPAWAVRIAA